MYINFAEVGDQDGGGFRFAFQDSDSSGEAAETPAPWDIAELTASSIKLTRCHFMRGPVTVWGAADLTCALTGSGDVTVAAKINTEDHSVTLVAGGTGTAWDASVNESSKYYLLPRYVLNRAAETDGWSVKVDCRDIPQLAVYV